MKFKVYLDQAGSYRWKLVKRNGRITADSGEGYYNRSNAHRAIHKLLNDLGACTTPEIVDV